MKLLLFFVMTSLCFFLSGKLMAQEEVAIQLKPAAELNFPTELGKYYFIQSSIDMVNWIDGAIIEGDGEDYRTPQLFSAPQRYTRVLVTATPPAAKAFSSLVGKTLFFEEYVFNFPEPLSLEVTEESEFSSQTSGVILPISGSAVSFVYTLVIFSYNSADLVRVLPSGEVEKIYLSYNSAIGGTYNRRVQVNGVETSLDFGLFRIEDTEP